jgi:hypothetical protein
MLSSADLAGQQHRNAIHSEKVHRGTELAVFFTI